MEDRVNSLLEEINNLINTAYIPEEAHIVICVEDINDIALFNVGEININDLTIHFNNWMVVEDNNVNNNNYVSVSPQANLERIEPNVYKITFQFYGYDELLSSVTYNLCTASVKYILNNLLLHQITISKC
jgi:hypothetical protein